MGQLVHILCQALGHPDAIAALEMLAGGGIMFTALNVPSAQIAFANIRCVILQTPFALSHKMRMPTLM